MKKNMLQKFFYISGVILLTLSHEVVCHYTPFPIQFSIPEIKMVKEIPEKTRDFAFIVPGKLSTYIYNEEEPYYRGYQCAYYAITQKKGGWDCMRHYEILANGCIPYFLDIDKCPEKIMTFLPKELIKEAMNLPGVSYLHIDHTKFDKDRYYELLNKILEHTRKYLTTKSMASYLLNTMNYKGNGNILFLTKDIFPDYQRCLTLIGLKELFGEKVIDIPKITHIYTTFVDGSRYLGGNRGFSFTKILPDLAVNRDNIEQRIKNKEFDLIVYGSIHRGEPNGTPYLELIKQYYTSDQILYICGEDSHPCQFTYLQNLFLREYEEVQS